MKVGPTFSRINEGRLEVSATIIAKIESYFLHTTLIARRLVLENDDLFEEPILNAGEDLRSFFFDSSG